MQFKGEFGVVYDDSVMEISIQLNGEECVLGVNPRTMVVEYAPKMVQDELAYTFNHATAQINRTHYYWGDPCEYDKPCKDMSLRNILFHLGWNDWNGRIGAEFNAFDDEIMNLSRVIDYECSQLLKELNQEFLDDNDGRVLGIIAENEYMNNVTRYTYEIGHYDPYDDRFFEEMYDSPVQVIEHRAGSGGGWGGCVWAHSYYNPTPSQQLLKVLKNLVKEQNE